MTVQYRLQPTNRDLLRCGAQTTQQVNKRLLIMLQHPPYRVGGENRFFTYELLVCPYHTRTIHSTFDPRTGERDNWIEIQECILLLFFSSSLPSIQPAAAVSGVGWPFGFIPELLSRSGIFTHLRSIDSDCVLIVRVRYIKRLIYTAILLAPPTEICLFLLSIRRRTIDRGG